METRSLTFHRFTEYAVVGATFLGDFFHFFALSLLWGGKIHTLALILRQAPGEVRVP